MWQPQHKHSSLSQFESFNLCHYMSDSHFVGPTVIFLFYFIPFWIKVSTSTFRKSPNQRKLQCVLFQLSHPFLLNILLFWKIISQFEYDTKCLVETLLLQCVTASYDDDQWEEMWFRSMVFQMACWTWINSCWLSEDLLPDLVFLAVRHLLISYSHSFSSPPPH